ncbi:MAG TPA: sulfatase [Thermoanaerobaculia bacterium]|jgi:arylsulfatase A-like enzyme|nr:sulfatase [Thermoanaerobaculia bacterium]
MLALAGCGGEDSGDVRLLLDGEHAADALVEDRAISRPPALGGNRFLSGWWPSKKGGELLFRPEPPRARLQIVNLGNTARTLYLDLKQAPAASSKVRVKAAGRDLGAFPLADPTEIRLPADLPEGRVNLDLAFEADVRVLGAGVRPALPAGKVASRGADIVQSGDSMVDIVRRVTPGTELTGTFVPPDSPEKGQRFEITVLLEDGSPVRRFAWSPSFWNRLLGRKTIELPLGETDGWVRIRLRARGAGPAATWKKLGLRGGQPGGRVESVRTVQDVKASMPRLVIVYVMDALRADTVGALGGPAGISPTWDRLAGEGMLFRNHRSVAPNTIPSTKAFFTGHPFVDRGGWKLLPEDGPTLAEMFRAAGYHTGLFSGNVYVSPAYGTDRGFEHVAEEVLIDEYSAENKPPFNDNAARAQAAALKWLTSLPKGERAFLYIHTIHPHNPYDPPEPFRSRYTAGIPSSIDGSTETLWDIKQKRRAATAADRKRLRGLYNGSFAYNDAELAGFVEQLAAWAPKEETLLALTADHGEEHFEHGGILHGFTLFEEQLRIPLLLWAPGRIRPSRVDQRTDTLDLHRTLVDLCGLKEKEGAPGRQLLRVAQGETGDYIHRAAASSVRGGIYSALHGRWKVVWAPRTGVSWGQGDALGRSREPEYLFDLEKDPGEQVNLAGDGDLEAAWLRERLLAWVKKNRGASAHPEEQPVDQKTLERLKALGYANP